MLKTSHDYYSWLEYYISLQRGCIQKQYNHEKAHPAVEEEWEQRHRNVGSDQVLLTPLGFFFSGGTPIGDGARAGSSCLHVQLTIQSGRREGLCIQPISGRLHPGDRMTLSLIGMLPQKRDPSSAKSPVSGPGGWLEDDYNQWDGVLHAKNEAAISSLYCFCTSQHFLSIFG